MDVSESDYVVFEDATFRGPSGPVFAQTSFRLQADERWAVRGEGRSLFVAAMIGRLPLISGSLRHPFLASDPRCVDSVYGVLPVRSIAVSSMVEHRALTAGRAFHQIRWHGSLASDAKTVADFLSQGEVETRNPFAVTTDEEKRRFDAAFAREVGRFDLRPLLARPLVALSNGELHRLLIARALMLDPRLLIVDDPYSGLDVRTRGRLAEILAALPSAGTGVLHVAARDEDVAPDVTHEVVLSESTIVHAGARVAVRTTNLPGPFFSGHARAAGEDAALAPQVSGRSDPEPVLELRNVTVRHGAVTLLAGVDWTILPGERWALVGPNGAGKSTLLSLALADNPQAYRNHVVVGGLRLGPGTSIWDLKQLVGWVSPELDAHYPGGSRVVDVVASGFRSSLGVYGAVGAEERTIASEWVDRLGLGGCGELAFGDLSSLHRRLALLARACVHRPLLLLLDEPSQGLDTTDRKRLAMALDTALAHLSAALVYVTHDAGELPPSIDHVLEIEEGRVVRRTGTARGEPALPSS